MAFYWVKTNRLVKLIFSKYVWDIPDSGKKVYLTFDDGPTPEITEWTLAQLRQYQVKATFFCIGDNVRKYPEIFQKVITEGHSVGNHTFNHLNGWKTETAAYIENAKQYETAVRKLISSDSRLFRPPYGKITDSQSKTLRKLGYKIIMWDILSADFDSAITPENCLKNVLSNVKPGSIIIFHDSVKAFQNLVYALPKTLAFLKEKGFECEVLR